MSGRPHDGGSAGRAPRNVHARIARWAFVRVLEQGRAPTLHMVGYIAEHQRLGDDAGEPYVGSSLTSVDLDRRMAVNRRGRDYRTDRRPGAAWRSTARHPTDDA